MCRMDRCAEWSDVQNGQMWIMDSTVQCRALARLQTRLIMPPSTVHPCAYTLVCSDSQHKALAHLQVVQSDHATVNGTIISGRTYTRKWYTHFRPYLYNCTLISGHNYTIVHSFMAILIQLCTHFQPYLYNCTLISSHTYTIVHSIPAILIQLYTQVRPYLYNCTLISGHTYTIVHSFPAILIQLCTHSRPYLCNCTLISVHNCILICSARPWRAWKRCRLIVLNFLWPLTRIWLWKQFAQTRLL